MVRVYELSARYDSRAKFYGKAQVVMPGDGRIILQSYSTQVAEISADGKTLTIDSWYSMTTARHIKEFALQHGFGEVKYGASKATKR